MEPLTIILGMSALLITQKLVDKASDKKKDYDVDVLNDFFKTARFCNRDQEPQYAYVKWCETESTHKTFGIEIPLGCDINVLFKMKYALENLFKNDVEILYDNQNYRIRVYRDKLKDGKAYPFEVVKVPDTKHLYINVGMSLSGPLIIDLTETIPNILLAGTTNCGKSKESKNIICQLLENYTHEQLKLYYLDNKGGLEANAFKYTKHLSCISKNPKETIDKLLDLKEEMYSRMEMMENCDATNIVEYNEKNPNDKLPFIFTVIDELFAFATLPSSSNDPDYQYTQKVAYRTMGEIASMCRAAGVHLMFCTQKPTSDVIPTYITCNCGIRIGMRTANDQESQNIIGESGLELIREDCKGAGIVKTGKMTKFQAYWLTTEDVKKICRKHRRETSTVQEETSKTPMNNTVNWSNIFGEVN